MQLEYNNAVSASACKHNNQCSGIPVDRLREYSPTTVYIISMLESCAIFWNSSFKKLEDGSCFQALTVDC